MGRKNSYSQEKKRISSLWTKTKNFQKMLNAFLHPSVVKIDDKDIFCDTLKKRKRKRNKRKKNKNENQ